jgi:hypothetical protein
VVEPDRTHADLDLAWAGRDRIGNIGDAQVTVAEKLEGAHQFRRLVAVGVNPGATDIGGRIAAAPAA